VLCEPHCQTHRVRLVKRRAFRRPKHPACADRAMWRPDLIDAAVRKDVCLTNAKDERGIPMGGSQAPAARRQAAAREPANANSATGRRSPLLRKSRAAANGQESKVRCRKVRASAASAAQPSGLFRPRRPSVLRRQSAFLPGASTLQDRALRKRPDRNRPRPARPPEGATRRREVLPGDVKNAEIDSTRQLGGDRSCDRRRGCGFTQTRPLRSQGGDRNA
jgi:hypothetical protein